MATCCCSDQKAAQYVKNQRQCVNLWVKESIFSIWLCESTTSQCQHTTMWVNKPMSARKLREWTSQHQCSTNWINKSMSVYDYVSQRVYVTVRLCKSMSLRQPANMWVNRVNESTSAKNMWVWVKVDENLNQWVNVSMWKRESKKIVT
jgi:hypothetical protein